MSRQLAILIKTDFSNVHDKLYAVFYILADKIQLIGDKIEVMTNTPKSIKMIDDSCYLHVFKPGMMGMISPRTRITTGYGFQVYKGSSVEFLYANDKITLTIEPCAVATPESPKAVGYTFGDVFLKSAAQAVGAVAGATAQTFNTVADSVGLVSSSKATTAANEAAPEAERKFDEELEGRPIATSLEGQDLTFQNAWKALGEEHAANMFSEIGKVFEFIKNEPEKTQFRHALMFISGKFEGGPNRMSAIGKRRDDTIFVEFRKTELVDESVTWESLIRDTEFEHLFQLKAFDETCTATFSGIFDKFFSIEGFLFCFHVYIFHYSSSFYICLFIR